MSIIIFKKAFGLKSIPWNSAQWLLEFLNKKIEFSIKETSVCVELGTLGVSREEKIEISRFFHPDERDLNYISEIPTIDITLNVDLATFEQKIKDGCTNDRIKTFIEPFINTAFLAFSRVVDAYRTSKYNIKHESEAWKKGMISIIPEITESEFKTFLFYRCKINAKDYVGCFSEGHMSVSSSQDNLLIAKEIDKLVADEIPLNKKLIVLAWEYLFQEDYRNSVIYAATVLELTIISTLRKHYTKNSFGTSSQVDKFLDNVSNRLLCTVVLGALGIASQELRDKIASAFDIRNGLVHGKRKKVTKDEAINIIKYTEELLKALNVFETTNRQKIC